MKFGVLFCAINLFGALAFGADTYWVVNRDVTILKGYSSLVIMEIQENDPSNPLKAYASCNINFPSKDYDRPVSQGVEFRQVSFQLEKWREPTFDEVVKSAKDRLGYDVQFEAHDLSALIIELKLKYNLVFNDGKDDTNYLIKLVSTKSGAQYDVKCVVAKKGVSHEQLIDLLIEFGTLSPPRDL